MKYPSGALPCLVKAYPTKAIGTPRTRAVRTDLNENTETFIPLPLQFDARDGPRASF
jgi:hypothetical protein